MVTGTCNLSGRGGGGGGGVLHGRRPSCQTTQYNIIGLYKSNSDVFRECGDILVY